MCGISHYIVAYPPAVRINRGRSGLYYYACKIGIESENQISPVKIIHYFFIEFFHQCLQRVFNKLSVKKPVSKCFVISHLVTCPNYIIFSMSLSIGLFIFLVRWDQRSLVSILVLWGKVGTIVSSTEGADVANQIVWWTICVVICSYHHSHFSILSCSCDSFSNE